MPFDVTYNTPYTCPKCSCKQMVYTGDPNDITRVDVDRVKCGLCDNIEFVCDEFTKDTLEVDEETNEIIGGNEETGVPIKNSILKMM